ncbi:putative hydroxymethylpyrimidine transport system ATP-binding protein [Shimia abyssi]|uniref:Putative hydroxymethylpyrimidine transport system ATP-binding protein n=2 Tax=Shimia abyssi TaxID=1662395 RepID=A0A2P8EX52_9RHOB|nr:putative hydroxymethylpyrimidine transport system ATP-binding protein [Shimia abyssi]
MAAPALHLKGSARIGDQIIFADLDLSVQAGAWTCLLGASGVGKSTVLRLFAGLTKDIDVDGSYGASDGALEGRVALMAQDDLLLPWLSALDNVLIGARLRAQRPDWTRGEDVLARVGLRDHIAKRPGELSGGQRQRVALARTLMEDRPIVLLDEPFSALDALTRAQMQELAAELLLDRTVLLVTHDPAEAARLGHRIVIMTDAGLQDVPVPTGNVPRAVDASDVLKAQADLLNQLRIKQ